MSFEDSNSWRVKIKQALESYKDGQYSCFCTNPNDYFMIDGNLHSSEREAMEFDLGRVRNSDLVIVNFNSVRSLGTMAEIAIAYENKIPIIGYKPQDTFLHPWQKEMTNRIFEDMDKLIEYVIDYYLN